MNPRTLAALSCAAMLACGTSNNGTQTNTHVAPPAPSIGATTRPTEPLVQPTTTPPTAAQARLFAESANALALDLWAHMPAGNAVISPASIAIALDMTEPSFVALTREQYGAPLEPLDLVGAPDAARAHINAWVAEQTRERIQDLVPEGAIAADTRAS